MRRRVRGAGFSSQEWASGMIRSMVSRVMIVGSVVFFTTLEMVMAVSLFLPRSPGRRMVAEFSVADFRRDSADLAKPPEGSLGAKVMLGLGGTVFLRESGSRIWTGESCFSMAVAQRATVRKEPTLPPMMSRVPDLFFCSGGAKSRSGNKGFSVWVCQ